MYNYHLSLQNNKQDQILKKMEASQQHYLLAKAKKEKDMIANHQKRVEYSILRLIDKPTRINIYRDPVYRPREQNKENRKVSNQMHFNYEMQASRIEKSLHRNASLDSIPFRNSQHHCFRQSFDNDSYKKRMTNICKNTLGEQNIGKVIDTKQRKDENSIVIEEGKEVDIYPKYVRHPKTYFHTFQTIANQADSLKIFMRQNVKDKRSQLQKKMSSQQCDPFRYVNKMPLFQNKEKPKQTIKRIPLKVLKCREALQKCGVSMISKKHMSNYTQR